MEKALERYVLKGGNIPTSVLLDCMIQENIKESINNLISEIQNHTENTSLKLKKELIQTFEEYRDKIIKIFQNDFTKMEAEIRQIENEKRNRRCKMQWGKDLLKKKIEKGIQQLMKDCKSQPLLDVYAVERMLFIRHMIEEGLLDWKEVEKIIGWEEKNTKKACNSNKILVQ